MEESSQIELRRRRHHHHLSRSRYHSSYIPKSIFTEHVRLGEQNVSSGDVCDYVAMKLECEVVVHKTFVSFFNSPILSTRPQYTPPQARGVRMYPRATDVEYSGPAKKKALARLVVEMSRPQRIWLQLSVKTFFEAVYGSPALLYFFKAVQWISGICRFEGAAERRYRASRDCYTRAISNLGASVDTPSQRRGTGMSHCEWWPPSTSM